MLAWPSKSTRNKNKTAQGIAMEIHFINGYGKYWMDETYSG